MAKKSSYTQCKMEKPLAEGASIHVAWIPTKYAKVGKVLKIKLNGDWSDNWKVVETWAKENWTPQEVAERQKRWEEHRKHSDI